MNGIFSKWKGNYPCKTRGCFHFSLWISITIVKIFSAKLRNQSSWDHPEVRKTHAQ